MPPVCKKSFVRKSTIFALEALDERIVPDVTPGGPPPPPLPFAVDDAQSYNFLQPSSPVRVLDNDQNNPGATWNYGSLTVVNPTQFGSLSLDPTTGILLYTPNAVTQPPGGPPAQFRQDSFTYYVKNSLGLQTNTATV